MCVRTEEDKLNSGLQVGHGNKQPQPLKEAEAEAEGEKPPRMA